MRRRTPTKHALARRLALGALTCSLACAAGASCGQALAASPPAVGTGAATNVTSTSAVLHGTVNPHGAPTNFVFQFGVTRGYGGQTPLAPAGAGTSTVKVSQPIGGLRPDTTYHYRILAVGAGSAAGRDHTFKTAKVPLAFTLRASRNPVVFGSAFVLAGTLSGSGNAGRRVVLKIDPFPFARGFASFGAPAITGPTGAFSFFVPGLLQNSLLRVVTSGAPSAASPLLAEHVAVRVSFHVRHTRRAGFARLYGAVVPAEAGARVAFQRLRRDHRWVTESGTVVRAHTATDSRFSRIVHLRHRGLYRALVAIADPAHVSNHSSPAFVH
jgi:hypothetical protein